MNPGTLDDPRELVDVACALCGSRERRERFREGVRAVVTCRVCDLTYVTPRLTEAALLERVYDEGYWRSAAARERGYSDYRGDRDLYLATYRKRWRLLAPHVRPGARLLDVGCAAGYFLEVAREEGLDVWGFEPSAAILESARMRLGAERVRGGRLGEAGFEPQSFDLVTLWDVLEHTALPLDTLAEVARLVRPGGIVLVETQNVNSLAAKLLGRRWQHYKHAEHLHHFHRGTLARALGEVGLTIVLVTPRFAGKYVSGRFLVERAARLHPWLSKLLASCEGLLPRRIYVNPFDELIVLARATKTVA